MGIFDSFQDGRAAARNGAPLQRAPGNAGPPPGRPSPAAPAPIKLGYYYDREKNKVGGPLLFHGERHVVLFGLNGAGKSTRFLIELMMTVSRSLFVFDIKGELAFQCGDERRRFGTTWIINPYHLHGLGSDGYNPLTVLQPDSMFFFDDARHIGLAIVEIDEGSGKFWSNTAQDFLTGLLMFEALEAAREKRVPSMANVRRMLTEADAWERVTVRGKTIRVQTKGLAVTATRMIECGNSKIADLAGRFVADHAKDTLESIRLTAIAETAWILSDHIAEDMAKDSPVDFRQMPHVPTTVFVCLPPDELEDKRRWTRVLLASALRAHFGPGTQRTLFILDEFRAAVGRLPIIATVWSLVRGYGVQLMPILQSALQLQTLFREEWENYPAQAGLVATLGPPGDDFTAEWMSKRCGVTTILQTGFSLSDGVNSGDGVNARDGMSGGGGSSSNAGRNSGGGLSFQQVERRVLLPQELRDLEPGHGRIWLPGMGTRSIPFFAPNYWKRREPWVARVKPNPLYRS
jgi:type IV secretion system protein VirD4